MVPEREKANLMPTPTPGDLWDVENTTGRNARGRRRLADVYSPRGVTGSPMALDFAATSGMQMGALQQSAYDPTSAILAYEQRTPLKIYAAAKDFALPLWS